METPNLSRESTDLDRERPVEDAAPTVLKRRFTDRLLARSRRQSREDGVINVQEPKQQKGRLSQIIRSAIAKSRKVFSVLARETCLL